MLGWSGLRSAIARVPSKMASMRPLLADMPHAICHVIAMLMNSVVGPTDSEYTNITALSHTPTSTGPPSSATVAGWTYYGCYVDTDNIRTLTYGATTFGGGYDLTVEICLSSCHDSGFVLAGVEFGTQCSCGNYLQGRY